MANPKDAYDVCPPIQNLFPKAVTGTGNSAAAVSAAAAAMAAKKTSRGKGGFGGGMAETFGVS